MKKRIKLSLLFGFLTSFIIVSGCGKVPIKEYYILNYLPTADKNLKQRKPYQVTIRLREFNIEEAYNRPQIVYRQSPFQLRYYVYRVWAVKPTRMITDLVYKHLVSANLVSSVIRRFDEGPKPDYELSGMIEALEEYDSEELWFAHLAFRLKLVSLSDGKTVYTRRFDHRKRVFQHEPEYVIREMSSLMEYAMTQAINDIDVKLAEEFGQVQNRLQDTSQTDHLIQDSSINRVN